MYEVDEHGGGRVDVVVEDVEPMALFTESLLGLSTVLGEPSGGTPVTHEIQLGPVDLEGLLSAWLEELLRLAREDGFVPERVERERLETTTFSARIAGVREIPAEQIRALALQRLELKRLDDGAWAVRAGFADRS